MKRLWIIMICAVLLFAVIEPTKAAYAFNSTAEAAILIETKTGSVLFAKNEDKKLPMASTTKIATALTVLENCDKNETVTIDGRAVGVEGSSIYLKEGERWKVIDLLYGLMLRSGNDAATALAIHVSGSVEDFAHLMNKTAAEYGAINTHFTNPHGLHDKNHYTTAKDLAHLTAVALKNPTFAEIVATKSITVSHDSQSVTFVNKNKLLASLDDATGVKTGYTKAAGRCFVGSAAGDETQFVCVVLNCGAMFEETASMLKNAINRYTITNIVYQNQIVGRVKPTNRSVYVPLMTEQGFKLLSDGNVKVHTEIICYDNLVAPLKRGSVGGIINVYSENRLLFSAKLYTIQDVK